MQTLTLKAPAKLNLYLRIVGKRPDGFHNIETIFEKIELCDKITLIKRKSGIRISCRHKDLPKAQRNLAYQAAQAILAETNSRAGVEIKIKKKIPIACGLGGGSSDAASVLLGLNRLLSLQWGKQRLLELSARLGADVPFFVLSKPRAFGRGKGEILTPLGLKRRFWYILVIPRGLAVSTRQMYQDRRLTLTKRPSSAKIIQRSLDKGDLTALKLYSYNSFEPILHQKYKRITEIKKALASSGVPAALVSGKGPCVFGITQTRKEAMGLSRKLRAANKNWQVIVSRTYSNRKI